MPGQVWGTATLGGNLSIGTLSKKLRQTAQPLIRGDQFCRPEPGAGRNKGDTVYINKISDLSDAGTATALTETQTIPIDNVTIARSTMTYNEYGRGVSFTGKLEDLSEFQIDSVIMPPLKNHAAKVTNNLALNQFKATYLQYTPTGTVAVPTGTFDTDGTISTAATRDIQVFDVYEIGLQAH